MDKPRKANKKLQRERELQGWSQAKLAEKIGTTVKRVSMWECGNTAPGRYYQESLIQLFGKNAQELGFLDDEDLSENGASQLHIFHTNGTSAQETNAPQLALPDTSPNSQSVQLLIPNGVPVYITVQTREQTSAPLFSENGTSVLVDEQPHAAAYSKYENTAMPKEESGSEALKRRDFFRETGRVAIAGAAYLASHDMLSNELLDRFHRALQKPATIDSRMLTYLEKRTGEYWQDRHGAILASSDLLGYALEHFQKITGMLEGPLLPGQRVQLCTIASKTALLIGEIFIDMSHFSRARQFDGIAIKAAQEAGDSALEAITRGRMSLAWTYSENIPMALTSVQEARVLSVQCADVPICSWLAAIEAEVQANLHNSNASLKALDEAERIENYSGFSSDNYLIRFDGALLRGYQGVCFRRLYHPDDASSTIYLEKAQGVLLDSLALLDATSMQRQPTFLTDLADTYIQQREIEEACKCATQAVIGASQIKLQKVVHKLHKLRGELRPWQDSQYVKNLDGYLAPLLPTGIQS